MLEAQGAREAMLRRRGREAAFRDFTLRLVLRPPPPYAQAARMGPDS